MKRRGQSTFQGAWDLRPKVLGSMAVPVEFYSLAISVMLWRASERMGLTSIPRRFALAGFVGAILFLLSDSIVAFRLFVGPLPFQQINATLP